MKKDKFYFMEIAIEQAIIARENGEVPVGAIVVLSGKIVGRGYNSVIENRDPTAHAEIVAIRDAGQKLKNYRLIEAEMYVSLEPCLMCYSAMVNARIKKLYYSAFDLKSGIFSTKKFSQVANTYNHYIKVEEGILKDKSSELLIDFFEVRRGAGAVERGGLENR